MLTVPASKFLAILSRTGMFGGSLAVYQAFTLYHGMYDRPVVLFTIRLAKFFASDASQIALNAGYINVEILLQTPRERSRDAYHH